MTRTEWLNSLWKLEVLYKEGVITEEVRARLIGELIDKEQAEWNAIEMENALGKRNG